MIYIKGTPQPIKGRDVPYALFRAEARGYWKLSENNGGVKILRPLISPPPPPAAWREDVTGLYVRVSGGMGEKLYF